MEVRLVLCVILVCILLHSSFSAEKEIANDSDELLPSITVAPPSNETSSTAAPVVPPIVKISSKAGYVGENIKSPAGPHVVFKGIRFARPPIGELRYQAPVRADPPIGMVNATEFGSPCLQLDPLKVNTTQGSEDCLFLNVFTPKLPPEGQSQPVMVWFHEGGFQNGQAHTYLPDYLVREGVIVVTMHYRLGPLGFLSTGDQYLVGNWGLLDQVAALEWVRDFIQFFGGDPNRVTIFGTDSGGLSVGLHLLSPPSRGLFHAAISQSSSVLAPFAIQQEPFVHARLVASQLNCHSATSIQVAICVKQRSPVDVILAEARAEEVLQDDPSRRPPYSSAPVVQPSNLPGIFLPLHPLDALLEGNFTRVPYVMGVVNHEGATDVLNFVLPLLLNRTIENPDYMQEVYLPSLAQVAEVEQNHAAFVEAVRFQYFMDDDLRTIKPLEEPLVKLYSDLYVVAPAIRAASLLSRRLPVFFYGFEHSGQRPLLELFSSGASRRLRHPEKPFARGNYVTHGEELLYLFRFRHPGTKEIIELSDKKDIRVRNITVRLWTNMAKFGYPTVPGGFLPPWRPQQVAGGQPFYRIGLNPGMHSSMPHRRMLFWNYLVPRMSQVDFCADGSEEDDS